MNVVALPSDRRHHETYTKRMAMECSVPDARAICDRVARVHQYQVVSVQPDQVHYEPVSYESRKDSLPALDLQFEQAGDTTIVSISASRRSSFLRLRKSHVGTRTQVVVFRDHIWCDAANQSVKARLT
jgi:hypothetical protein